MNDSRLFLSFCFFLLRLDSLIDELAKLARHLEMRYELGVERGGFANTPPPLATIEVVETGEAGEQTSALGVMFGFVRNQGDGWTLALDYLLRYLDDAMYEGAPGATPPGRPADLPDPDNFFLALARQLGLRTAQMHR